MKLPTTVLFGKRIGGRERGLTINRNPAAECKAFLVDDANGSNAPLYWRSTDGTSPRRVSILCGESCSLVFFGRLDDEPGRYFIFEPMNSGSSVPRLPKDGVRFSDTRSFVVHIAYSHGRQELTFAATVRKDHRGDLTFEVESGGVSF